MSEALENVANLFKAVSDVGRLKVLRALFSGEKSVGQLSEDVGDEVSVVSHRLKVLYQQRLITKRREGQFIFYNLADDHVNKLVMNAIHHVMECE